MSHDTPCPCGSGRGLDACCGPYLRGEATAPTAEALMRSRYTAYTLSDAAYLLRTWQSDTRPERLDLRGEPQGRWLGLKILRAEGGGAQDTQGRVEFVARFKHGGKAERLHEVSRFVREGGLWLYVDGEIKPSTQKH